MRRAVARRILKGTAVLLTTLVLAAFVFSLFADVGWNDVSGRWGAGLTGGVAWAGAKRGVPIGGQASQWGGPGWSFECSGNRFDFCFSFGWDAFMNWGLLPKWGEAFGVTYVTVPLLLPLLIAATPMLFLAHRWHCHRRLSRIGRCRKCGYSLHGLVDSRCPECGVPFENSK